MLIRSVSEARFQLSEIEVAALGPYEEMQGHRDGPLDWMYRMKFLPIGRHPIGGHALNAVEQINQTWSWIAALKAVELLLPMHPNAGGYALAPDARMSQALDIMSVEPGLVGAEVFAAVHPRNNRKLAKDLSKLVLRSEQHRYVFFLSPAFPVAGRQPQLESDGVQVWALSLPFAV